MNITIMKYTHSDKFDLLGKYLLKIFVAIVIEKKWKFDFLKKENNIIQFKNI